MSTNEFWEDDPNLFWAYRFSYYQRLKRETETFNYNAWLQGAYFYEAVSVALCNSLSKKSVSYSPKPYEFKKEKKEEDNNSLMDDIKARVKQVQSMWANKDKESDILIGGAKR